MRVLLDASDLIDLVEHERPHAADLVVTTFREQSWRFVFSNTNVSEFASAIHRTADRLKIRALLLKLEELPHIVIRDAFVESLELVEAFVAFRRNTEPDPASVFGDRWDEVMVPVGRPKQTEKVVNLHIHDIVFRLARDGVFDWSNFSQSTVDAILEDRESRKTSKVTDFDRFWRTLAARMRVFALGPTQDEERRRLAKWLASNPRRCPGTWFAYRVREELVSNKGDIPKIGDLADLNHMCCVPYVDAATFDRRMLGYARTAAAKIKKSQGVDYTQRLKANLGDILAGA